MGLATSGLDPVAQLLEEDGDVYQAISDIVRSMDGSDYVFVAVIGGPVYVAKWSDEPYWFVEASIKEGKTGAWDNEIDKLAKDLPSGSKIIDVIGGERFLITEEQ